MKYVLLTTAALAAMAAAPAQATEVLTQTVSIPAAAPTAGHAINFNQFDTSLGTLESVTLSFASTLIASLSITSGSNGAHSGTITTGGTADIVGNGFHFTDLLASGSTGYDIPKNSKGLTFNLDPISDAGSDSATLSSGLAAFLGTGNVSFTFSSTSLFALSGAQTDTFTGTPSIGAAATLTYNYDLAPPPPPPSVPEPTSWLMMLAGFGALGMVMRRRPRTSISFA